MRRWSIVSLLVFVGCGTAWSQVGTRVEAVWAAGPLEARVGFSRPIEPGIATALVGTRIVSGDPESRGILNIAAARLEDAGRTLVLSTDPHSRDTDYVLELPAPFKTRLKYDLRGVEVSWFDAGKDAGTAWKGWMPELEYGNAMSRLRGWVGVHALPLKLRTPGKVSFRTLATLPKGKSTVSVQANLPFEVELGNETAKSAAATNGGNRAEVAAATDSDPLELTLTFKTDGKTPLAFEATYRGAGDANNRKLEPSMLTLPWAPAKPTNLPPSPVAESLLNGGDPAKGAAIFKGDQAKCANCHKIRGQGNEIGPDLTDLFRRDRSWVFRSINEPSATIHPDYVPYTVLTKDGRPLVGIIRAVGADAIRVTDTEAKATVIPKSDIDELKPSATSIMPVGLLGAVGEEGVRDLIAFLTTQPADKQ
jgi:putative heme-binding domain-containing protein